jgi:NitT/TauT family transport system ATP-binding protein
VLADGGEVLGLAGRRRAAVFQDDRLCEQLDAVANVRLVRPRGAPSADVASRNPLSMCMT